MKKKASVLVSIALAALLSPACAQNPAPSRALPDLTFASARKISIDAGGIEIVDAYKAPLREPNVEHLFATTPAVAARNLLGNALVAEGSSRTLRVTIENASVVDRKLPLGKDVVGTFGRKPSNTYTAHLMLKFELVDPTEPGVVTRHAEVAAHRSKTLLNGDTPAERDQAFADLIAELMKDVSAGLEGIVAQTFGTK